MKEFVLCLCLLFSQYPKSEINIYSDYYYNSDIPILAPRVMILPVDENVDLIYKAFEELYTPLSYAVKYGAPIQPFDRAVYDSLNILFEKKYENFDFFKEEAYVLFSGCDCDFCQKSGIECVNEKHRSHFSFYSEENNKLAKKIVSEMKQSGEHLVQMNEECYIRQEDGIFYLYFKATPFLYYYEKARAEYREILED